MFSIWVLLPCLLIRLNVSSLRHHKGVNFMASANGSLSCEEDELSCSLSTY